VSRISQASQGLVSQLASDAFIEIIPMQSAATLLAPIPVNTPITITCSQKLGLEALIEFGILQAVPEPVLGAAAMVMFGAVAASGINILAGIKLDRRALLIVAVSLALGLGVSQVPEFLSHLPSAVHNIFESGVATGGICALLMNWFLPESPQKANA